MCADITEHWNRFLRTRPMTMNSGPAQKISRPPCVPAPQWRANISCMSLVSSHLCLAVASGIEAQTISRPPCVPAIEPQCHNGGQTFSYMSLVSSHLCPAVAGLKGHLARWISQIRQRFLGMKFILLLVAVAVRVLNLNFLT